MNFFQLLSKLILKPQSNSNILQLLVWEKDSYSTFTLEKKIVSIKSKSRLHLAHIN